MVFDTSKIRPVDLTHKIIPMTGPVGCDQIAERVGVEGVIWPIEEYCSYVDDSVYQIVKMKTHLKTHIETRLFSRDVLRPLRAPALRCGAWHHHHP